MSQPEKLTTTVSTKGQVILPRAIRQHRDWGAGTRLTVEETAEGVLLKRMPTFAPTRSADVFGMLPNDGTPKTLEDMEDAIIAEARQSHDRG